MTPTHPLRLRGFRLLFAGRTLSLLGDGVVPAAQERAQIREGEMDEAGLPKESPALLGERVPDSEQDR